MLVKILDIKGTWRSIADSARTTIGMEEGNGEPSTSWKRRMLLAEHSPIRKLIVSWKWFNIFWWIQTHFTRHKVGVEWWSETSRTDRTGKERNTPNSQENLINLEGEATAQAIINISRKRLCSQTALETRITWKTLLQALKLREPELASICVPECIYRGWCYEYKSCGYHLTDDYKLSLNQYRKNINKWEG